MLKHEEMIENVHRRIAQYEEEKKMKHSKFKNIFSAVKPKTKKDETNEDGYIEVESGIERIEPSHRILRMVSTLAAGAVLITGIGAAGVMLHRNKPLKPAVTDEDSNLREVEDSSKNIVITEDDPFAGLLNTNYDMAFPNLTFSAAMREKVRELFGSVQSWKVASDYNRFVHYDNGGVYSPLAQRIIFSSNNYCLQICDDNIIEYSVLEDLDWKKSFYECDSLYLINGIADIMESEFKDNGVDFDEDVSDFNIHASMEQIVELSDIQKRMLTLCMKGSSWKEETMQANRDTSLFDLSLVSTSSGRLDIIAEQPYTDSNTGLALFTDKNGISYTCRNTFFSNDILYIMSAYNYPDMKPDISIIDADGNEVISANDENRAQLEHFIYHDFPAMLKYYTDYHYPNDYETSTYSIEISYKTGNTELRSAGYSIGNFGSVGRVDYVLDPVSGWSPAGCVNYTLDYSAFEVKLDELLNHKQKDDNGAKKDDKKPDEAQPTTESENKPSDEEPQQDKPANNEEQGQNMNGFVDPPVYPETTIPNEDDDYDDIYSPKRTGVYIMENGKSIIASSKTHDINALEEFVTKTLDTAIEQHNSPDDPSDSSELIYTVLRVYKDTDGVTKYSYYMIFEDGHILVFFYQYELWSEGVKEWVPHGSDGSALNFKELRATIDELVKDSALSDN